MYIMGLTPCPHPNASRPRKLPGVKALVSPITYMLPRLRLHTLVGWPKAKR